jgi:O-antigen/teichoic acid export membrane protein
MLIRSTIIYLPAILLPRISAILLLIVTTRLVSQTEYGLLALVVAIGEMTDAAVSNWLRIALLRLGGTGTIASGSLKRATTVLIGTSAAAILVAIFASMLIVPERAGEFALAVSAYIVAGSVSRHALCILQMQQRRVTYTMMEFARSICVIVLPITAIVLVEPTFLAASLATSLGTLACGIAGLRIAYRQVESGPARFSYGELFSLGVPLIVLALISFGLDAIERPLLKLFHDAGVVAVYAAAYALARQPIDILGNAINQGAFPEMVSIFDTRGPAAAGAFIVQQLNLIAMLILPAAAFLMVLGPDIVGLILPESYHADAGAVFPVVVASVVLFNFKVFVFDNVFHAHKRNWLQSASLLPGAVIGIALSLYLIPTYAALGAAWGYLAACGIGLLTSIAMSSSLLRLPVALSDLGRALIVALGVFVVTAIVRQWTADEWVLVRLVLAGAAGGAAFLTLVALLHRQEAQTLITTLGLRRA